MQTQKKIFITLGVILICLVTLTFAVYVKMKITMDNDLDLVSKHISQEGLDGLLTDIRVNPVGSDTATSGFHSYLEKYNNLSKEQRYIDEQDIRLLFGEPDFKKNITEGESNYTVWWYFTYNPFSANRRVYAFNTADFVFYNGTQIVE